MFYVINDCVCIYFILLFDIRLQKYKIFLNKYWTLYFMKFLNSLNSPSYLIIDCIRFFDIHVFCV